jgi:Uma2 family endonuclease
VTLPRTATFRYPEASLETAAMQTTRDQPAAATLHRFDVDDYHRMAAAGMLSPEDRVELIEGEIVDMAPIGTEHAATTAILNELVSRALATGQAQVRIQGPLRLDRRNEPQPDLMLLRPRPGRYRSGHPAAADVLLLVEVADSSLAWDCGPKLALYARHGVPEVWIVDLVGRAVEICRTPGPEGYAERRRLSEGDVTSALVPGLTIGLAELLG